MQTFILIAAALGLAMPTMAMPLEGSSALQARGTTNYLLTCADNLYGNGGSDENGAKLFTLICVTRYHCEHSLSPTQSSGEYIGGCTNCPAGISQNAFGGCVTVAQK
jgi:hypothetical protein